VSTGPKSKTKVPTVFLSQEQTQILQLVKDGKSIFYTGSAGQSIHAYSTTFSPNDTSLTILLVSKRNWQVRPSSRDHKDSPHCPSQVSRCCRNYSVNGFVVITSYSLICSCYIAGIAACNIGGVTIHSFAGIGLGTENAEDLASKVRKNKKASARWSRTKVLIVDEGA
jgi:ATP-dependent DNA helicase PIF1